MKSNIPEYTIKHYGDTIEVTPEEIADEGKIEEVKQALIQQAMMCAARLVEQNIKIYKDTRDGKTVVGWIMPFAVKNGGESIEWARGKNE